MGCRVFSLVVELWGVCHFYWVFMASLKKKCILLACLCEFGVVMVFWRRKCASIAHASCCIGGQIPNNDGDECQWPSLAEICMWSSLYYMSWVVEFGHWLLGCEMCATPLECSWSVERRNACSWRVCVNLERSWYFDSTNVHHPLIHHVVLVVK